MSVVRYLNLRPVWRRSLWRSGLTALILLASISPASATVSCSDIRELIDYAKIRFTTIQGTKDQRPGHYATTFSLANATHCVLFEDVEKRSYQCSWKYPYGDKLAREQFDQLLATLRQCIGEKSKERKDKPVNHPDFYESYTFELSNTKIRISLKNKGQTHVTWVSILAAV